MEKSREVWCVVVKATQARNSSREFYVFATSAAMAEKRALARAKTCGEWEPVDGKLYVESASFEHYVS